MLRKKVATSRPLRFLLVGGLNTLLHFLVLNLTFYALGVGKIQASILATIFAVSLSFFLNRDFVFRATSTRRIRQAVLFSVVTISGMLLIHNGIYIFTLYALSGFNSQIISTLLQITGIRFGYDFVAINFATILGAVGAILWNYNGYKYIVFKGTVNQNVEA